jgi:hypothetical protein
MILQVSLALDLGAACFNLLHIKGQCTIFDVAAPDHSPNFRFGTCSLAEGRSEASATIMTMRGGVWCDAPRQHMQLSLRVTLLVKLLTTKNIAGDICAWALKLGLENSSLGSAKCNLGSWLCMLGYIRPCGYVCAKLSRSPVLTPAAVVMLPLLG